MKHFRKLPPPKDYKSLRLFVRWFREHQMKRYITLNNLKQKGPIIFNNEMLEGACESAYISLLRSIVEAKPIFVTGKIGTKYNHSI